MKFKEYNSYSEYIKKQTSKQRRTNFKKSRKKGSGKLVRKLCKLFEQTLHDVQLDSTNVLCLGARYGEEVQAWRLLGFNAIGIDLDPGEDNSFVIPGDFHYIPFKDSIFDIVYTNSIDHCLYFERLIKEMQRVLKNDGIVIITAKKDTGPYWSCSWGTKELEEELKKFMGEFRRYESSTYVFHGC